MDLSYLYHLFVCVISVKRHVDNSHGGWKCLLDQDLCLDQDFVGQCNGQIRRQRFASLTSCQSGPLGIETLVLNRKQPQIKCVYHSVPQ